MKRVSVTLALHPALEIFVPLLTRRWIVRMKKEDSASLVNEGDLLRTPMIAFG